MRLSKRTLIAAVACLCVGSSQLAAQTVRFVGTTTGCFFTTGTCSPTTSATLYDLTFNEGAFDAWTSNGKLVLGSPTNNLGTFTLGGAPYPYRSGGWNFLLNVVFSLPTITAPGAVYSALIGGIVRSETNGTVHVVFDETPQVFNFEGENGQLGYFSLVVPQFGVPVSVGPVPVTGEIEATVTPEPATMALLATGLAGLIPAARRRRRSTQA